MHTEKMLFGSREKYYLEELTVMRISSAVYFILMSCQMKQWHSSELECYQHNNMFLLMVAMLTLDINASQFYLLLCARFW